jgi:hypothetical protein
VVQKVGDVFKKQTEKEEVERIFATILLAWVHLFSLDKKRANRIRYAKYKYQNQPKISKR